MTKSVSRFARNTVDSLTTIRKLIENGIECYFEKENIWTFDGRMVINPAEAETVKKIYRLFLEGMTPYGISRQLEADGDLSPSHKPKWNATTVKRILSNEKYKGDALLQKTYTVDYLTKKTKANEGEIPQYYVEGDHECCPYVNTFEPPQKARIYGIFRHSAFAHPSSEHLI